MRALTYYAAIFLVVLVCRADAAQMTVWSSNGVREAFVELIPQFEKATGHRVMVSWDGTLNIRKRIDSGEVADVVFMPAADVDTLIASGGLMPGSRVDLAKSIVGVAVRAGVSTPDVSTSDKLRRAMLGAAGGILKTTKDAAAARELLTFLRSPRNAAVLKKAGLELP